MSEKPENRNTVVPQEQQAAPVRASENVESVVAAGAEPPAAQQLDAVEEIDFLLEEIENKIAPLALA